MQMEARHKLDQAIALDCCSRIDLAIRNTDRFPNTIALELVLIDNERPDAPSLSLGSQMVTSRPDGNQDPIPPVAETLSFPVPSGRSHSGVRRVQDRVPARPAAHGPEREGGDGPLHPHPRWIAVIR